MAVLIVYIILKLTGVIHSPEWLNLLPIITLVFMVGGFYQKIMSFTEAMYKRTDYLKNKLDNVSSKLEEHNLRILTIEHQKSK